MNPASVWEKIDMRPIKGAFSAIYSILGALFVMWYLVMLFSAGIKAQNFAHFVRFGIFLPALMVILYAFYLWLLTIVLHELCHTMGFQTLREDVNRIVIYSATVFVSGAAFAPIPYIGKVIAGTAFCYHFYLIHTASLHLVSMYKPRKIIFFSSFYTLSLLLLLIMFVFYKIIGLKI